VYVTRLQAETSKVLSSERSHQSIHTAILTSTALESIQGMYYDKAYGRLVVCAVSSTMPVGFKALETPQEYTAAISTNPFSLAPGSPPTFIAKTDKHWSNYLMFQHVGGSTFDVTANAFFSEHSVNVTQLFEKTRAIFTKDGMAWSGNMWDVWPSVAEASPSTGDLKVDAEVWFDKVAEVTFDSSE
jgi:hypothetical protein